MIYKVRFGKKIIQYSIIKSDRRKTSEIIVDKKDVIVRTPISKSNYQIKKIVQDKAQWVYKKQLQFKDRKKMEKLQKSKTLTSKSLENRTWKLAQKIGVNPSKVVIKKLKSRWGSATEDGTINLNIVLTNVPKKVADYIIVHELCHLKIKEHSFRFWNLVSKYDPNYRKNISWLDQNPITVKKPTR